jgi:mannose-6-phosphate isomerase-like protein (cupin superfamily)
MKIIRSNNIDFIPASHENPTSPGVLKRILLERQDLMEGRVQMINWALLPQGRSFARHYHEDMEEVFVIIHGNARITVDAQEAFLGPGDTVVIPAGSVHRMENTGRDDVEYIVVGISGTGQGKTIVIGHET